MEDKIIILIVVLVAIAGIGGYFVGLYQGSGNFSINVNNSTNGSNSSVTVPKTTTTTNGSVTPVKNTTKKNSTGNNSTS